jgi:hypothetical protein
MSSLNPVNRDPSNASGAEVSAQTISTERMKANLNSLAAGGYMRCHMSVKAFARALADRVGDQIDPRKLPGEIRKLYEEYRNGAALDGRALDPDLIEDVQDTDHVFQALDRIAEIALS